MNNLKNKTIEDIKEMVSVFQQDTINTPCCIQDTYMLEKEKMFLLACFAYIEETMAESQQCLENILKLIECADKTFKNGTTVLDVYMKDLESKNKEAIALSFYKAFKNSLETEEMYYVIVSSAYMRLKSNL